MLARLCRDRNGGGVHTAAVSPPTETKINPFLSYAGGSVDP
jgi:hypothetical protein